MSVMSDLDLMVREGDRTAEDFEARGIEPKRAEAMADLVAKTQPQQPELREIRKTEYTEQEVYDTLRKFDLIDGEGFYTVYETKR